MTLGMVGYGKTSQQSRFLWTP